MTDQSRLHELESRVEELENRLDSLEERFSAEPEELKKGLAINEFIVEKDPLSDNDRTLLIGYYLEKYDGISVFTTGEIKEGYQRAKQKIPANVSDTIQQNIKKGFIAEAKDKKENKNAYYVTSTGVGYAEDEL